MKLTFFKYYFSLIALFVTACSCCANTLFTSQKNTESIFLNVDSAVELVNLPIAKYSETTLNNDLHSSKIVQTYTVHYKGNLSEIDFGTQNPLKIQKIKVLFKVIVLFFATHLAIYYHTTKSTTILAKLSVFFSYLKTNLFLRLRVIRL